MKRVLSAFAIITVLVLCFVFVGCTLDIDDGIDDGIDDSPYELPKDGIITSAGQLHAVLNE